MIINSWKETIYSICIAQAFTKSNCVELVRLTSLKFLYDSWRSLSTENAMAIPRMTFSHGAKFKESTSWGQCGTWRKNSIEWSDFWIFLLQKLESIHTSCNALYLQLQTRDCNKPSPSGIEQLFYKYIRMRLMQLSGQCKTKLYMNYLTAFIY